MKCRGYSGTLYTAQSSKNKIVFLSRWLHPEKYESDLFGFLKTRFVWWGLSCLGSWLWDRVFSSKIWRGAKLL